MRTLSIDGYDKALEERLAMLKTLLRNFDKFEGIEFVGLEIVNLTKNFYAENVAMLFMAKYPEFVKIISERGVTLLELGCCCLYAMEVRPSLVGELIHRKPSIYNFNSFIHRKLNISDRCDLNKYFSDLFVEIYGLKEAKKIQVDR